MLGDIMWQKLLYYQLCTAQLAKRAQNVAIKQVNPCINVKQIPGLKKLLHNSLAQMCKNVTLLVEKILQNCIS